MSCLLSWSGGKDSAFALITLAGEVDALLTTFVESTGNLPHVDVPMSLVRAQAEVLGLPLLEVAVPDPWSAELYAERMTRALSDSGAERVVFGDLHLEELRRSREANLAGAGLRADFPCWTDDPARRAREIIDAGIGAILVSVDTRRLDPGFMGRRFDHELLADLPDGVDPCGEHGEFQTFVVDVPGAPAPLAHRRGQAHQRGDFLTLELQPARTT